MSPAQTVGEATATPPRRFLVAEDDPLLARALRRTLERWRPTEIALTIPDAEAAIEREEFSGFVFDLRFGGVQDAGLKLLEKVRERLPSTAAIVVTGELERDLINRALRLDALYACKPVGEAELRPFVYRAMLHGIAGEERVNQSIQQLIAQATLQPQEADLLVYAVAGTPRVDIARLRGMSENTLKLHIRSLLAKLEANSLDDVRAILYRIALGLA